jgi:hypothetical protein
MRGYITNTSQYCNFVLPSNLPIGSVTITNGQDYCFDAVQSISTGGNGDTFIVQSGGNVHLIAGQSVHLYPTTIASSGSTLHAYISVDGLYCNNPKSLISSNTDDEQVIPDMPTDLSSNNLFKVYPNPTAGTITLELTTEPNGTPIKVQLFNLMGSLIMEKEFHFGKKHMFTIADQTSGLYLFRVTRGNETGMRKVIKQ